MIHLLSYSSHQLKNEHYFPGLMNMYHLGANHNQCLKDRNNWYFPPVWTLQGRGNREVSANGPAPVASQGCPGAQGAVL